MQNSAVNIHLETHLGTNTSLILQMETGGNRLLIID